MVSRGAVARPVNVEESVVSSALASIENPRQMRALFDFFLAQRMPFLLLVDSGKLKGWGGPDLGGHPITLAFDEELYEHVLRLPSGLLEARSDAFVVSLSFDAVYDCRIPYDAMVQISVIPSMPPSAPPEPRLTLVSNRDES